MYDEVVAARLVPPQPRERSGRWLRRPRHLRHRGRGLLRLLRRRRPVGDCSATRTSSFPRPGSSRRASVPPASSCASLGKRMAARTADGSAVLAQSKGFEHYIATAEANQIRWEEAQDVFSRFLPYAIVFGLADRWAEHLRGGRRGRRRRGPLHRQPALVRRELGPGRLRRRRLEHGLVLHGRGRHLRRRPRAPPGRAASAAAAASPAAVAAARRAAPGSRTAGSRARDGPPRACGAARPGPEQG